MPGGIGTTYEILSCIETKRAGEHNKKIVIVNSYGYYNEFINMLKNMQKQGFVEEKDFNMFKVVDTVEEGIEYLIK